MFSFLKHLIELYRLAIRLRRHGALRALSAMPMMPTIIPTLLRVTTFFIPRKIKLPSCDGERLAAALATMGPAYIKLGETLATRPDVVGRPLAKGLATLQDKLPPFGGAIAKDIIELELGGKLEDHFAEFDMTAVAAASIAQVHKAVTIEGETVAVKVLRPDVERRFLRDLGLFSWLGALAERHIKEAKRLRLTAVVDTVREATLKEMDLRVEAAAAAELANNMQGEAGYRIPDVDWDRTSARVMTMEWVDGIRLNDVEDLEAAGFDMEALSARVVQVFLRQAMRDGYFHADLHQGNLIVEADGTIAAVDFGIMGRLSKPERRFLAEILYGFIKRDYARVAEVHFDAGYIPRSESLDEFTQALKVIADPIMDLPIEEISAGKLLAQLFATTERFSMQTQPQLIMLQRTMVMAEGMALHLDPRANMWQISEPVLEHWIRENLSPEIRLADFINTIPRLIERLPYALDRLLEKLDADDATVNSTVINQGYSGWTVIGLSLIAAVTAIALSNFWVN